MSDSWRPHGPQPTRLFCPWDFPGKNTRVDCHFLLQGIFPTEGLNTHLLHWQVDSLLLSHQGSSLSLKIVYNFIVDEPLPSLYESSISPHKSFALSKLLCCKAYDAMLHPLGSQCPQVQCKSWMNTWRPCHYLDYRKLLEERN